MTTPVTSRLDFFARLQTQRAAIEALGVRRLGLIGSLARGAHTPESDVDVLVEFQPGQKNFDRFMALAALLEDALQRPVDLLTPESLSPYLGPRMLQDVEYVEV